MRIFMKIFGGLLILILFLLLWTIKKVDYTPYFETDYYKTTNSRFDSLAANLNAEKGSIQVGFGKRSITPELNGNMDDPSIGKFVEIPLAGYGGREGAPATGS